GDLADLVSRAAAAEQARIARLPTFEQDDCGDGRNFPDIPYADEELVARSLAMPEEETYPRPRFRENPGDYMTLGLRKLGMEEWLIVDETYREFYNAKKYLLETKQAEVIKVLPEAEDACKELMQEVVGFWLDKYPKYYDVVKRAGVRKIRNKVVKEELRLDPPYDVHLLEMCARLAMEDFNILRKSEFSGMHYLIASATAFPAGWRLSCRIGKSIFNLHGPINEWKSKLLQPVEHYFSRLTSKTCLECSTFFIQTDPDSRPLEELLFIQAGKDFFPGNIWNLHPQDIIIRRERQIFRQLPKSNTVALTVKTSVQSLTDLPKEGRKNLVRRLSRGRRGLRRLRGESFGVGRLLGFVRGSGWLCWRMWT
ncbi:uncharacterized protein BDR25DRAFT_370514, partial [Lindgomyces ingoldianus]